MYVLHRRDDPNVFGLVDPEDVELVDDRAWLQWEKKVGRG